VIFVILYSVKKLTKNIALLWEKDLLWYANNILLSEQDVSSMVLFHTEARS